MEDFNKTFIKFLFVAFFIFAVIATSGCSKKVYNSGSKPSPQGGQDSGGGDPQASRKNIVEGHLRDVEAIKEDVNYILTDIYRRLTFNPEDVLDGHTKKETQLFLSFYEKLVERKILVEVEESDAFQLELSETLNSGGRDYSYEPSLTGGVTARGASAQELNSYLGYIGYYNFSLMINKLVDELAAQRNIKVTRNFKDYKIGNVEINVKKDEACEDLYKNSKTGSVKSFDGDILEICISAQQFEKVSENALTQQINALVAHELSHLGGYLEDEAQIIERIVLDAQAKNYNEQPGTFTVTSIIDQTIKLKNATELLQNLFDEKTLEELSTCQTQVKTKKYIQTTFNIISMDYYDRYLFIRNYRKYIGIRNLVFTKLEQKVYHSLFTLENVSSEVDSMASAFRSILYDDKVCQYIKDEDYAFMKARLEQMLERLDFIMATFSAVSVAL